MAIKRCLTISFKSTSKDLALYNLLNNTEDRSTEIKRLLYTALIEQSGSKEVEQKSENKKENIDILNF